MPSCPYALVEGRWAERQVSMALYRAMLRRVTSARIEALHFTGTASTKQKGGARATGRRCAPRSRQAAEHPPEPCEEDGGAASTSLQRPTYHSRAQASACRNGCSSLSGPIHVFWMRISRCSWTPMKPQIFCK